MKKNSINTTKNPHLLLKKFSNSHHTYFAPQHVQMHVDGDSQGWGTQKGCFY
jgi:hypothetical protein